MVSVNDHLVTYCASSYIHAFAPSEDTGAPCIPVPADALDDQALVDPSGLLLFPPLLFPPLLFPPLLFPPLLFPPLLFNHVPVQPDTMTGKVEVLLARIGSNVFADTCTLLLIVPACTACTVILRVTDDPTGSCVIVRVYVLPITLAHVAETIVNHAGRVSVTTTSVAESGPLLLISILYWNDCPIYAVFTVALLVIARSAHVACTVVLTYEKLFDHVSF